MLINDNWKKTNYGKNRIANSRKYAWRKLQILGNIGSRHHQKTGIKEKIRRKE